MIDPQSAQLGASAWVWKLTFVAPRLSVMADVLPPPPPFPLALPWPLAVVPCAASLVAMTASSSLAGAASAVTALALGASVFVGGGATSPAVGWPAELASGVAPEPAMAGPAERLAVEPAPAERLPTAGSLTIADRSMSPRIALSSVDRNRDPSHRKM